MDIDSLKAQWVEYDRKLDDGIRLNRRLLMAVNMNRVRSPLRRFAVLAGLGAFTACIGLMLLGQFIYEHWAEARFALPAVALHIWFIGMVAASVRQVAMALRIDYDQPVAAIQKQIESLRALRIRATQWALLTGQLVWWTPFPIVAFKGFWGLDAYRIFGGVYLSINLAFGFAIIPLAVWASRKYRGRMANRPWLERLMGSLAGYNLNAGARFLAALSEFERES
jgi:hypothetical protein